MLGCDFLISIVYHNFKSTWSKGGCGLLRSDLYGWTRILSLWGSVVAVVSFYGSVVAMLAEII